MDYLQQHWEKLALVFGFLCLALFGYQYLTVRQQTSESGEVSELETQVSELLNRRSPVNPEVNDYLARVKAPWQGEVEPVTEKYFAFHMPLLIHLTKEKVVEEKYQLPNFAKDERGRFRIEKKVTLENGVQVKCVLETIEETKKIKEATPDIIELQRKLPSEEEWTTVDSVKQPGSQKEFSFSDTNVEARTTYAYRIRFHVDPEKIEKKEDAELVTPATRSSDVMKVTTKGIFRIQFITTGGDSANIGVQKYNRDSQQWEPGLDQWEKYWVEPART